MKGDNRVLFTVNFTVSVVCASRQLRKNGKVLTFEAVGIDETGYSRERCYPSKTILTSLFFFYFFNWS